MKRILLALFSLFVFAANGQVNQLYDDLIDTNYGVNGFARSDTYDGVAKTVLYKDTLYALTGSYSSIGMVKVNPQGIIDSTFFNGDDFLAKFPTTNVVINDIVISNDSALYLIGTQGRAQLSASDTSTLFIAKYFISGVSDTSFGVNGIFRTSFQNFPYSFGKTITIDTLNGKLYALVYRGNTNSVNSGYVNERAPVAVRVNTNGTLDTSWSNNGIDSLKTRPQSIFIDNNKLLLAGSKWATSNPVYDKILFVEQIDINTLYDTIIPNLLDSVKFSWFSTIDIFFDNHQIYYTGSFDAYPEQLPDTSMFAIVRLKDNYRLDEDFGDNGLSLVNYENYRALDEIKIDFDEEHNIYGTGIINNFAAPSYSLSILVCKLSETGILDTLFGQRGKYKIDLPYYSGVNVNSFINLNTDRSIIISGNWPDTLGEQNDRSDFYACKLINGQMVLGLIDNPAITSSVLAYPNPIQNGTLNLSYELSNKQEVAIDLYDIKGQLITRLMPQQTRTNGKNTESLMLPQSLSAGQYVLRITAGYYKKGVSVIVE